jgi:hypothetical protein
MHIDRSFRFFSGISQHFWQELQQRSLRVPNSQQLLTFLTETLVASLLAFSDAPLEDASSGDSGG